MRILFTFAGGRGHFEPLLPIARAAEAAGHAVAMAGRTAMVPDIEAAGFAGLAVEPDAGGPPKRMPLQELDPDREDRDLRDGFADRMARERAALLGALCAKWRPDLVVCDETDFGSMIVAERLGLPYATVLVIAAGSFVRTELVAERLSRLRAEHGLPRDPELTMLTRYLVLSPVPPSFRDAAFPLPATGHSFRAPVAESAADDALAGWLAQRVDAPIVYFTLGTVFNIESGDLFSRVLAGLRDLRINLAVTVGREIDPEEFGPQPPHVHVERFIPQAALLPHCDLVVSHGGSGSVLGALAHGVPMVLIPMGADQPHNAARCARLGVGRVLDALRVTPASAREAVFAVLADPAFRRGAERLRDELAALPGPERAVSLLERLAAEKRPLLAT